MTPGLFAGSATTSRPVSVTAERIFFARHRRVVEQVDAAGRRQALAHLLLRRLQVHHPRPGLGDEPGGHGEGLPEAVVEPGREVAGQLEVLALVVTDRHLVGLVDEDVGGHEHRVGEQPDRAAVGALALALVLELRHPAGLAEPGHALQHPRQLHVLGHVALHEQRAARRVDAEREQLRGRGQRVLPQLGGVPVGG